MAKLTLEEKRLKSLKLQLFGKEDNFKSAPKPANPKIQVTRQDFHEPVNIADSHTLTTNSYVKSDLIKIALLVMMAISVELILYFANLHNLINLKF